MQTRGRKRSRTCHTRQNGSYEKKLNVGIAAKLEEFEIYASRSQRKRALLGTALQGLAKRPKRCNKDHKSNIDRYSENDLQYLTIGVRKSGLPTAVVKTSKSDCTPFKSTEKESFQDHPIMKSLPPQSTFLFPNEPGNGIRPIFQEKRNRLGMTVASRPQTTLNSARRYPRSLLKAAKTAQKATKGASAKLHSSKLSTLNRWWKTVLSIISITMVVHALNSKQPFEKDCIYVNGGGFGGFWFILGQLYKLNQESEIKDYVCYSAGCLGAVSVLANRTFEDLFDSALTIQTNWKDGSLSRFDAVEQFVDDLLGNSTSELDVAAFSNVHILTSVPKSGGWEVHQNIAEDIGQLKTLLVQTAWIPFLTGDHIWHPTTGHMDGGFSRLQHPTCNIHISLPWDWNLLVNTMNLNMGKEEGNRYWELGLNYNGA